MREQRWGWATLTVVVALAAVVLEKRVVDADCEANARLAELVDQLHEGCIGSGCARKRSTLTLRGRRFQRISDCTLNTVFANAPILQHVIKNNKKT